jgi:hypothetical protein
MVNRINKDTLQNQVGRLNAYLHEAAHMDLDYAGCYGGYCLVNYGGSHHATPRMSAKEMHQYLNGALDWITGDK